MQTGPILNISCYLFVSLTDTAALCERLHARAEALGLKGTVLIAEEGINLFLAGPADDVNTWVDELRADARFATLMPKESWSEVQPFQRLKVKVKPEIIRMLHGTSLASVVTLLDVTGAAREINAKYYLPFEAFITAGAFYFVMTLSLVGLFRWAEARWLKPMMSR